MELTPGFRTWHAKAGNCPVGENGRTCEDVAIEEENPVLFSNPWGSVDSVVSARFAGRNCLEVYLDETREPFSIEKPRGLCWRDETLARMVGIPESVFGLTPKGREALHAARAGDKAIERIAAERPVDAFARVRLPGGGEVDVPGYRAPNGDVTFEDLPRGEVVGVTLYRNGPLIPARGLPVVPPSEELSLRGLGLDVVLGFPPTPAPVSPAPLCRRCDLGIVEGDFRAEVYGGGEVHFRCLDADEAERAHGVAHRAAVAHFEEVIRRDPEANGWPGRRPGFEAGDAEEIAAIRRAGPPAYSSDPEDFDP